MTGALKRRSPAAGLPSCEGSGLKLTLDRFGDQALLRLPSHEGSGLKFDVGLHPNEKAVSPLARGEWIEILALSPCSRI